MPVSYQHSSRDYNRLDEARAWKTGLENNDIKKEREDNRLSEPKIIEPDFKKS